MAASSKSGSKATAASMIESAPSKGRQSATWREIMSLGGFKVRLTVVSDAYAFQSSASAEIWNETDLRWNQVHYIPHGSMRTPAGLAYHSGPIRRADFAADLTDLLAMTKSILF